MRLGVELLESRELLAATIWTVDNTLDAGAGSLRQALVDANATPNDVAGPDIIQFNIPGVGVQSIALATGLPTITEAVLIDGWSQPGSVGSPPIELNGAGAGAGFVNGLIITASEVTVRGLIVNNFSGVGIFVAGSSATNVSIYGNYLGTDSTGTLDSGNAGGVYIDGGSHITVGTNADGVDDLRESNVISGMQSHGGVQAINTTDLIIQGNYLGTDVTGNFAITNADSNIRIALSSGVQIGGTQPGAGNLISGGAGFGIALVSDVHDVTIQGNRIGTNAAGTAALGNTFGIIATDRISDVLIGGTAPGEGNLISGNLYAGVLASHGTSRFTIQGNRIGTDASGTYALGNGYIGGVGLNGGDHLVGGTVPGAGNLISGNFSAGVSIAETVGPVRVEGNFIGTNLAGTAALANLDGVYVRAATGVVIGSADPAARNVISGNTNVGVALYGAAGSLVQGNYIGTDLSGTVAVPNRIGVDTNGSNDNDIIGNLISGNADNGVHIIGSTGNTVQGNKIGTDVTGSLDLGNGGEGIWLYGGTTGNLIGGSTPGAGNLISGNGRRGIMMQEADVHHNRIQGNYIGTDITGTATVGLGNGRDGVFISQGHDNLIGGSAPGEGNIISGNGGSGVGGLLAAGNVVQGNAIGTDAGGTLNLGNRGSGVEFFINSSGNVIGGASPGAGNTIAFNQNAGVVVTSGTGNAIRGNGIYSNGGLGIDLGADGVSPNDAGDGDSGPNNLQNFPVIASSEAGLTTHVVGSLNSTPNTSFTLDFYASASADPSGYGEGERYLGTITVTTDGSGDASFDDYLAGGTSDGEFITATATDPDGNTSEFSGQVVAVNQPPTADAGGPYFVFEGGSVVLDGTNSSDPNQPGETLVYEWDLDGDNVFGEVGANAVHGDETGPTPTFSAVGLDGPSSVIVTLRVTDNGGLSDESTATVTIDNAPPTATDNAYATSQATALTGNVITDDTGSGADSDPAGANDPLTVSSYTQPSNGTVVLNADGSFVYTPNSTFSGADSFTYTISDGDGGFDTATVTITVIPAGSGTVTTVPDTCLGGTALLIQGTSSDDHIVVSPGASAGTLEVTINGSSVTVAAPTGRIIVLAGAGDDDVQLAGSIANPAWLYGEDGNDRLNNGAGGGLLIGGNGNDQLTGGSGRDIMVGGQGADNLVGNSNDDILIAGYTTKDDRASAGHEHFWCDVMKEWTSTNSFEDRVNNLRGPATQKPNANNGASYLLPEVRDDNTADDIDMLQGSSGNDWFIYQTGEDKVVGQQEGSN